MAVKSAYIAKKAQKNQGKAGDTSGLFDKDEELDGAEDENKCAPSTPMPWIIEAFTTSSPKVVVVNVNKTADEGDSVPWLIEDFTTTTMPQN